jgi:uncharacterized protein YbaR (Trm112 family)
MSVPVAVKPKTISPVVCPSCNSSVLLVDRTRTIAVYTKTGTHVPSDISRERIYCASCGRKLPKDVAIEFRNSELYPAEKR